MNIVAKNFATIGLSVTNYIHGKNGFAEILKNLARDTKIILLELSK